MAAEAASRRCPNDRRVNGNECIVSTPSIRFFKHRFRVGDTFGELAAKPRVSALPDSPLFGIERNNARTCYTFVALTLTSAGLRVLILTPRCLRRSARVLGPRKKIMPEQASASPTAETATPADTEPPPNKGPRSHIVLLLSAALVLILLLIGTLLWWLHARHFESTDDAFIDTHIVRLASQIAGQVIAVTVDDNTLVEPGQALILIDSADAHSRVAQAMAQQAAAQAQVENARAQIRVSEATYGQSRADIAAAEAPARIAAQDLARYQRLANLNPAAVAAQQLDQARSTAQQTSSQLAAARKAAQIRLAQVGASHALLLAGEKQVEAAKAQLDEAGISLGYTQIVAPTAGHVTQKSVAVGDYVQPGTQILAIVPLQLWVTANFKETQITRMRAGQPVTVRADACPSARLTGHLDSIQRGAGQAFDILPPENATGNYVKVVQRVPVKIILDHIPSDCLVGPGMSVEPQIRVR